MRRIEIIMKMSVRKMAMVGVFLAFTCIISAIPLGVNIFGVAITFQTFAISFIGYVLGVRYGAATAALYVVIGLVLPVYSNMTSGLGVLLGPTGGFLWGFIPLAALCGWGMTTGRGIWKILLSLSGLLICHTVGIIQFMIIMDMDIIPSLVAITVPYLPKDICMVVVAYMVAKPVRRALKSINT